MIAGIPYRVVVIKGGNSVLDPQRVISRGDIDYALPRSIVGYALAYAPVGALFHSMGITYERAARPKEKP